MVMELKYFKSVEFERCSPPCKMEDCDPLALQKLDLLREHCGFPLKLNSAFRSVSYEKKKGRSGNSAHTRGLAFDIACYDTYNRALLVCLAQHLGFTRIGIHPKYVHIDCDVKHLPAPRLWLY